MKKYLPYIVGAILIIIIAYYVGIEKIAQAFSGVNILILPIVAMLEFVEYYLQVIRAKSIFKSMGYDVSSSLLTNYAIGHAVAFVTPQRLLGEFVRSFAFKKIFKIKLSDSFAFIAVERISDVVFLSLTVMLTSFLFVSEVPFAFYVGLLFAIGMILLLLLLVSKFFHNFVSKIMIYFKLLKLEEFMSKYVLASRKIIFSPKTIFISSFYTLFIWLSDYFRVWIIFYMFGYGLDFALVSGIIALSYLVAIVFVLPGGIGVFEGGASAVFAVFGVPISVAFSAMFVERIFSYWIWIILGFSFMSKRVIDFGSKKE